MPLVDEDPLWDPASTTTAARGRRPLSRERIVTAAVEIADLEGLGAVSMPRLARTLQSAPMSLYRHVPHKDALVDLMLNDAIGPPPADADAAAPWRSRLAAWARANLEVFRRHPWTLPLVSSDRRMGPQEVAWAESALRAVAAAGIDPPESGRILMLVNGYVRGAAAPVASRAPDAETVRRSGRGDSLPLYAALVGATARSPDDRDASFEYGLARVLDGVEAHLARTRGHPG